jgi:protein CMS1
MANGSNKTQKDDADAKSGRKDSKALLGGFSVAKLFARHFKLKEHEAWLREHTTPLAAGTPQRVAALIASGSLHLDSLQALVIDQTWVDAKQRNVFDTFETRDELMKLLALDAVMAALKRSASPTKLVLF